MATITLRVPDELDLELERQSAAQGVSKSDLAREALRRHLLVTDFRALRAELMARAQALGVHTDDDAFRVLKDR
jgi:Arc/MetJ-type ribon-helix-helix transcriptional regulator